MSPALRIYERFGMVYMEIKILLSFIEQNTSSTFDTKTCSRVVFKNLKKGHTLRSDPYTLLYFMRFMLSVEN